MYLGCRLTSTTGISSTTKEQVGVFAHTRRGLTLPPEEGVVAIEAILGEPDLSAGCPERHTSQPTYYKVDLASQ